MFKLSFKTYTADDNYWRSSLGVTFDEPVKFLCSGDQVCLNEQFSEGMQCINHSFDSLAIKELDEGLEGWLSTELATLETHCPTILTAVHTEKYHCVSELVKGAIKVSAITTAGIKSNAVHVYHDRKRHDVTSSTTLRPTTLKPATLKPATLKPTKMLGTINIIVCTNVNLTEAAMAQALGIVYESKTSLFYDNNWRSTYSDIMATGTGTDSVIIASSLNTTSDQVNYSGSHSIISGMISEVVRSSIECSIKKSGASN